MTGKRFVMGNEKFEDKIETYELHCIHDEDNTFYFIADSLENVQLLIRKLNALQEENERLKQQKPFLKIHNGYFIQYGDDKELFNLHKPSDIRSLIYLINRENGYDELECEYNEEGYGND